VHLKDGVDVIARRPHDSTIAGFVVAENVRRGRFDGFQVRVASDVGVRARDSDVTFERLEISGANGRGIEFSGDSRGALVASWIHDNIGAGIAILDSAAPVVENNLVFSNGAGKVPRPGLLLRSTVRPHVAGNIFLSNGAEAIWLPHDDPNIIDRNYYNVSGKPDKRPRFRIVPAEESSRESR
jgi:hypothetical protein